MDRINKVSRLLMDRWFTEMAVNYCLPEDVARQLHDIGYVIIEGAVAHTERAPLSAAYDAAVLAAHPDEVSVRSWPMIGFIYMIDEFRGDNGATRFVPGSHMLSREPDEMMKDATADCEGQTLACGPAGSVIIYNGSIWHGHTANRSAGRRRSIQGAFIRRDAQSAVNWAARISTETLCRIGNLGKYLLDI
ncbi:MAG: hypothetical protein DMF68_04205 [Acidobacteria bacterium]|nr:MAG: hypothetical protein DMF68_04205 [Acidobacteriota bacterium]